MSTTENMLLSLPTPLPSSSATKGPAFATQTTEAFLKVDSHNHQTRRGVKVPSAGILINADLDFNSFNLTRLRSLRFSSQGSALAVATDLNCLYSVDGDMWFNDGNGAQIQITDGNTLNTASIGSIGGDYVGSDASVYYSSTSKKFFFTSDTNIAGVMDVGRLTLRDTVALSNGVNLTAPSGLAGSYSLELPGALPGSTLIARLSSAGVITASLDADNSTVEVNSNSIQVKDLGITTGKINDAAVTNPKFEAANYVISSSSGAFSVVSGSFSAVTNLSVTITPKAGKVMVFLQPDGTSNASSLQHSSTTTWTLKITRNGSDFAFWQFVETANSSWDSKNPPGAISILDTTVSAGVPYTYAVEVRGSVSGTTRVNYVVLVAYEKYGI